MFTNKYKHLGNCHIHTTINQCTSVDLQLLWPLSNATKKLFGKQAIIKFATPYLSHMKIKAEI